MEYVIWQYFFNINNEIKSEISKGGLWPPMFYRPSCKKWGRSAQNIPEASRPQKLFCHPLCSFLSTFSTGFSTPVFLAAEGLSTLSTGLSTSVMLTVWRRNIRNPVSIISVKDEFYTNFFSAIFAGESEIFSAL